MDFPNLFLKFSSNFLFFTCFLLKFYFFLSNFPQLPGPEDYEVADSDDRLSELPDSLIIEILSFLPTRDVVRTTLVSKRWKDLWTTVPCLHFKHPWDYDGVHEFRNFVCEALAHWKGPKLVKFSLRCRPRCILDSWLLFAIEKQVEELKIWVMETEGDDRYGPYRAYIEYCIPSYLLCLCSSIKKLTLRACTLRDVENVQWDQLVSLSVESLEAFLGNVFNQLLSSAPRLEILNLQVLGDGEDLNIRSNRLKVFKIRMLPDIVSPMLRIDAPNLETLQITGIAYTSCSLNVPSLTNAVLDFFGQAAVVEEGFLRQFLVSIRHVQKLTLSDLCLEALCEMKRKNMVLPLSNAKFVTLFASPAHKILDVLAMFPHLRRLVIVREDMFRGSRVSNMMDPQTDFPSSFLMHLRTVEVAWLLRDTSIYLVIETLLKNAGVLEKMVFRPILFDEEEEMLSSYSLYEAEEKVLSMPRSSPTAQVIASPSSSYTWNWYKY